MSNTGQIIKSKQSGNFAIVPKKPFLRDDLTLQAKGLLIYLLTLPPNWVIYKRELPNHFINGRDSIIRAFNQLVEKKYIITIDIRNKKGQIKGYNHIVYDVAQEDNVKEPISGFTDVGLTATNKHI